MISRKWYWKAFSLVEVVIALGVVSVALIGILALISGSLKLGRAAEDDRVAVSSAGRILGEARASGRLEPVDINYYFDADGTLLANAGSAAYRIHAIATVDPDFIDAAGQANLIRYQLTIYPVAAGANTPNLRVIHATVAR